MFSWMLHFEHDSVVPVVEHLNLFCSMFCFAYQCGFTNIHDVSVTILAMLALTYGLLQQPAGEHLAAKSS